MNLNLTIYLSNSLTLVWDGRLQIFSTNFKSNSIKNHILIKTTLLQYLKIIHQGTLPLSPTFHQQNQDVQASSGMNAG
jgi:hypothetical protein